MLEPRQVGEGQAILARLEPEYEYDLETSMGTTNCCPCRKTGSTLRNFANLLTSSTGREEACNAGCA